MSADDRAREALAYGKRVAAGMFGREGNPSELTMTRSNVEIALANAYAAGERAALLELEAVPPTQPTGGGT